MWKIPWTEEPGELQSTGCKRAGHSLMTETVTKKDSLRLTFPVFDDLWYKAHRMKSFCNSMDCSPPGSTVHGIFHAGILEWVAFSYWSGLPGDLPDPGIELTSPGWQRESLQHQINCFIENMFLSTSFNVITIYQISRPPPTFVFSCT